MAEAKEKNDERSEEEKTTFFWRVLGDRVRKWYIKEKEERQQERPVETATSE